jgi:hypothetical protein
MSAASFSLSTGDIVVLPVRFSHDAEAVFLSWIARSDPFRQDDFLLRPQIQGLGQRELIDARTTVSSP